MRSYGSAPVKIQRSLGDTAVNDGTFGSTIQFFQTVYDINFTVQKLHFKRIGHLHDIDFWDLRVVQIILSKKSLPCLNYLAYNFNSLILFNNYNWASDLNWLFETWTDPEFFQNLI